MFRVFIFIKCSPNFISRILFIFSAVINLTKVTVARHIAQPTSLTSICYTLLTHKFRFHIYPFNILQIYFLRKKISNQPKSCAPIYIYIYIYTHTHVSLPAFNFKIENKFFLSARFDYNSPRETWRKNSTV